MQKGLTFGFCVEEMGREGWEQGAGLQGVRGRGGSRRQRGRQRRTMWTLGGVLALVF